MEESKQTIEELLKSMLTLSPEGGVSDNKRQLQNSLETWQRIQDGSWADGLDFSGEKEKDDFLKEWIANNPYNNI